MSAPVITATLPGRSETDVVLGRPIEIVFDQPINQATVSSATFSLMGPGQTSVVDADEAIRNSPKPVTGREFISGTFAFPEANRLVFTPGTPLRPNVTYTVMVVGKGSLLATSFIANAAGEALAQSLQFTFKTGELSQSTLPVSSPVPPVAPWEKPRLDSADILVNTRRTMGNTLDHVELTFPAAVDPASFDPDQLLVAVEAMLDDPTVAVPTNMRAAVTVIGNKIVIDLQPA